MTIWSQTPCALIVLPCLGEISPCLISTEYYQKLMIRKQLYSLDTTTHILKYICTYKFIHESLWKSCQALIYNFCRMILFELQKPTLWPMSTPSFGCHMHRSSNVYLISYWGIRRLRYFQNYPLTLLNAYSMYSKCVTI